MIYGSVCSGIEAASVAWQQLGWRAAFLSEIEAFPRAVLAHHYPDVPIHGDFTTIRAGEYAAIDVLVGGTPCQSFSVAGLRGGLADDRGNLALEYLRLAQRLRPKWLVWENVPGVLSSAGGRDFGSILGGLGELGYGFAYRVLDAQYVRIHGFGRAVPQRRRRVFVVGHLGDWRRAAAVLFERASLQGNPPPRREAGKGAAPTLAARTKGGGGLGTDFDCDGGLIAGTVAGTLGTRSADHPSGVKSESEFIVPVITRATAATLTRGAESSGKGGYAGRRQEDDDNLVASVAQTLDASYGEKWGLDDQHINNGGSLFVAHALRADGFDASEDGTGRGTPLIPILANGNEGANGAGIGALGDPAFPLQASIQQAIAFDETQITSSTNRCQPQAGETDHPLAAGARPPTIAFHARQDPDTGPVTHPLDTDGTSVGVFTNWRVRRLTPTECERLQGFPDGYTNVPYRGKPASDGPRYKALGNSMAVNVMRWIGHRIDMVENARVPAETKVA